MGLAASFESSILSAVSTFAKEASSNLMVPLIELAGAGLTIYYILQGLAIIRGEASEPLHDLMKHIIKMSFILALATSSTLYQTHVIGSVTGLVGMMTEAFTPGATTVGAMLDEQFWEVAPLTNMLLAEGARLSPWHNPTAGMPLFISAGLISLATQIAFIVAMSMSLIASVSLQLCFAVGPIFILAAGWNSTKRFAENWISVTLGFAMTNVVLGLLLSCLGAVAGSMVDSILKSTVDVSSLDAFTLLKSSVLDGKDYTTESIKMAQAYTNVIWSSFQYLATVVVLAFIMWQAKTFATALTGGVGIDGIGSWIASRLAFSRAMPKTGAEPKAPGGGQIKNTSKKSPTKSLPRYG
jgi:type IV secretion system protein VirB6